MLPPLGPWNEVTDPDELLKPTDHFYDFILKECKFDSAQYSNEHGTDLADVSNNHVRLLLQKGSLALELLGQGVHHLQLAPEPGEVWDELELLPNLENQITASSGTRKIGWILRDPRGTFSIECQRLHWREVPTWTGLRERYSAASDHDLCYYDPLLD